jgi:MATE family multidrug resistance protein
MSNRREVKHIFKMVWPAALTSLSFSLLEVMDLAMLGMVSVHALAGAALACTILCLIITFPLQMFKAMTPVAAANKRTTEQNLLGALLRVTLKMSITWGALACIAAIAVALMLPYVGYAPDLADNARTYLLWRAPFLPLELAFFCGWAMAEGFINTRTPLLSGIFCNILNVILNLLLVPRMGIAGGALATDLSMLGGIIILIHSFCRHCPPAGLTFRELIKNIRLKSPRQWDHQIREQLIRIGWPLGGSGLMDVIGWLVIGLLIPRLGTNAAATHSIMSQLISLGLALAQGSGIAITILVAQAFGRQDLRAARRYLFLTLLVQLGLGLLMGLMAIIVSVDWIQLFTSNQRIAENSRHLFPYGAMIICVESIVIVFCGALEGYGRTRVLLLATFLFDILFGLSTALVILPLHGIGGFYGVWMVKSFLKMGFLLLNCYRPARFNFLGFLMPVLGSSPLALPAEDHALYAVLPAPQGQRIQAKENHARWWNAPVPDT